MDVSKVLIGVFIAVVAFLAILFIAPAFLTEKSQAASFDWKSYGHYPATVCSYTVVTRSPDYSGLSGEGKTLLLRVKVPTSASSEQVKNALVDAIKKEAVRDRELIAVMALGYRENDPLPSTNDYTAGMAVWGPGGEFNCAEPNRPYSLSYHEPVKPPEPARPSTSSSRRRSSSRRSSGGSSRLPPRSSGGG